MDFFKGIGDFFGNLFGGGNKDDEEEKRRKAAAGQSTYQAPTKATAPTQNPVQQKLSAGFGTQQMPNNQIALPQLLTKAQPAPDQRNDVQKELDELTAAKLPKFIEQEKNNTSWFDRTFTNRDWNKVAERNARASAALEYQDRHGYDNKPAEIQRVFDDNSDFFDKRSADAAAATKRLDRFAERMNKVGQVAQYVPVTGSIINLGLAGAEATDLGGNKDAYRETRNKLDFDMTTEQYNQLDDETKQKLEILRGAGLALAPLDFVGLGGLVKTGLVKAGKQALVEGVTEGAVTAATKEALKQGAKQTAKNIAIPTAMGTGVSAGAQQYLSGEIDPAEAIKQGLIIGGTSQLFSGKLTKAAPNEVAPGVASVNPAREADIAADAQAKAVKQIETQAANENAALKQAGDVRPTKAAVAATPPVATALDTPDVTPPVSELVPTPQTNTIEAVIARADQELDAFKQANPTANAEQIARAQAAINARLAEQVRELRAAQPEPAAPTPVVETPQPLPAAVASPPAEPTRATSVPDAATSGEVSPAKSVDEMTIDQLAQPNSRPEAALQTAIEQAHNAGDDAKVAELINQLPEDMQAPMRSALGIPETAAEATATVAPRTHDALVTQVANALGTEEAQKSWFKSLKGKYMPRVPDNIDELKAKAAAVIENMDDDTLRNNFAATSVDDMVTNTSELALARAALDRLSRLPDDEVAVQMVKNIMDAMEKYVSKSGSALRFVQEDFDAMPVPMKVKYITKHIDSANKETPNYIPLAQDRARATLVETQITQFLEKGQDIARRASAVEGKLNEVADAAKNGQVSDADVSSLVKNLRSEKRALEANNGELVKFYQTLIPKRSTANRVFSDFPRLAMLSSFTGRVNDVISTSMNIANLGLENVTRGVLSKAYNLFRPGKATDTLRGVKQFGEGTVEGVRRGAAEFGQTNYVDDLQGALRAASDPRKAAQTLSRTGMQKAQGPIGNTVQAATEFATQASQGVKDQRLYQLAIKEAQQAGIEPGLLDQYARARSAVPSRQMVEAAEQLRLEVNNLNANPVTHVLNRVASSIEGKSAVGGFLKNQILPFTSWLGGNIWNSVTDKNVIANATKIIGSAAKGDADGVIRNVAKFGNNAAYTYALGYLLTQAGIITNENAEGYNDAGAYFHVGDRYIPVGFSGFFAPNIILGNAAYNGINSDGSDGRGAVETTIDDAVSNIFRHVALADAMGTDNNISRSIDTFNNSDSILDAGAQFASSAAGQFIPALAGDVNAGLNMSPLNPTGERAETKVVDPNSPSGEAKDVPKTALNQFLNRIPIYSQLGFPRKAGVAAPDLVDRVTRGSHDTETGKQEKAVAKTLEERTKDFEARGIPNPAAKSGFDDAVEARIQEGKFDAAIEGLQAKLDDNSKNADIPKSKSDEIRRRITELEVTRDGSFDPKVIDLYKKTNLTEWRNMGDPESEDYDQATYDLLWAYDSALANKGVSRNGTKADKNFYSTKEKKSGGRGRGSDADARVRSNTIGSVPTLSKIDFGNLRPEKAGSKPIPTIRQPRSSELVKKRKIAVRKA